MVDLSTTYMGLQLKNPLVPSASPLSANLDTVKRMEDAGAAAITLHSLFEEQIEFEAEALSHFLERGTDQFADQMPEINRFMGQPLRSFLLTAAPRRVIRDKPRPSRSVAP